MTPEAERILNAAITLNDEDKAAIAALLIESLDPEHDEGCERAWADEVAKRMRDVDNGEAKLVSWAEVRRTILDLDDDESR